MPNILIIYIDDMGWKDLGCYGSDFYETQNIDALAQTGMRFTQAYSASNVCSPSRHALLTGKYPARSHFTNIPMKAVGGRKLIDPVQDAVLDDEEVTFAEIFRNAGYQTGFFGKWHIGNENSHSLINKTHGFEIWQQVATEGGWKTPKILEDNEDPKEVTELTDLSIEFIQKAVQKDRPFLLYLSHHTVHVELQTTSSLHKKYSNKEEGSFGQSNPFVAGMIEDLDRETGRLLREIKRLGVLDNTVIVFTSDNGGQYNQFGRVVTRQTPLRSGKGSAYEGGTRVPLFICFPKIIKQGVSEVKTIQIDLYPTLIELAGLSLVPGHTIDGISLAPILNGKQNSNAPIFDREAIYWHYPHYKSITVPFTSIRKGDWKLIVYHEEELSPYGGKTKELFNLNNDIGESKNLVFEKPKIAEELYGDIVDYRIKMKAQMPKINPDFKYKN